MMDRIAFLVQTSVNPPSRGGKSTTASSCAATAGTTDHNNAWFRATMAASTSASLNGRTTPVSPSAAMLACSATDVSREHRELFGMRRLGEDRKGFFDHLKPGSFVKGVSALAAFILGGCPVAHLPSGITSATGHQSSNFCNAFLVVVIFFLFR